MLYDIYLLIYHLSSKHPFIYQLSISLSIFELSISQSIIYHLSIHLSIKHLSIYYQSLYPSINYLSHLSIYQSIYLSFLYPCINYLSIHPSISRRFSSVSNFAFHLSMWRHFDCHNWERGSSWHVVGRDQGSCSTPHRAQDAPHQSHPTPNISSAEAETPWFTYKIFIFSKHIFCGYHRIQKHVLKSKALFVLSLDPIFSQKQKCVLPIPQNSPQRDVIYSDHEDSSSGKGNRKQQKESSGSMLPSNPEG